MEQRSHAKNRDSILQTSSRRVIKQLFDKKALPDFRLTQNLRIQLSFIPI